LLQPKENPSSTLVIIHAGSGATDRNGNQAILQNNSLKMLAEALEQNGIASLRYDKRAIGESKVEGFKEEEYRFDDLVKDLKSWIIKMDSEYDYKNIVVIGHSEGSLIGMLACLNNPLTDKYISIAGPGRPADEIILDQLSAQGEGIGDMVLPYLQKLKSGDTIGSVPMSLMSIMRPSVQPYVISWFQYNPAIEISKLKIPVLIIQGDTDIQVAVSEAEMLHSAAHNSKLVIVKNMNHVLKSCKSMEYKSQMATYGNPELPLPKKFVKKVVKFILE
jgi:alpha-beta hydrolase superfamily lysophospholipase